MDEQDKRFGLSDVNKLHMAMMEHAAMTHDVGAVKSLPVELAMIASVLREQSMPQATINMALAARCGVPLEPIDCKSMYVQWTEDEPGEMEEAASHSKTDEGVTPGEFLTALQKNIFQHYQGDVFSAEIELTATPYGVLRCQSGQKVHMSLTFFRTQAEAKSEH